MILNLKALKERVEYKQFQMETLQKEHGLRALIFETHFTPCLSQLTAEDI